MFEMCDYINDIIKWEATSFILYLSMKKVCPFLICRQISKKKSQLIKAENPKNYSILFFCSSQLQFKVLQSSYWATFSLNNLQTLLRQKCLCLSIFINKKKDDRLDSLFDRFKLIRTWRTLLAPTVWSNKARTSVASWRVSATFAEAAGINSISMIFTPTTSPWWGVPRTPMLLLLKCGLLTSKVWQTEVMLFLI